MGRITVGICKVQKQQQLTCTPDNLRENELLLPCLSEQQPFSFIAQVVLMTLIRLLFFEPPFPYSGLKIPFPKMET